MAIGTLTSTTTLTTSTTIAGAKPSGLAVNDLMVAFHTVDTSTTSTPPAGWTLIRRVVSQDSRIFSLNSYYKFAVSGDVAASTFTFTAGASNAQALEIFRIPSAKFEAIDISSGTSNSGSNVTSLDASTLTPEVANSLIFLYQGNQNDGDATTYALATSSPTFTEDYDGSFNGGNLQRRSIAHAIRPQTTATGNGTVTINNGARMAIQMIVISPNQDLSVTVSESVSMSDVINSNTAIVLQESITLEDSVTTDKERIWLEENKVETIWTDESK